MHYINATPSLSSSSPSHPHGKGMLELEKIFASGEEAFGCVPMLSPGEEEQVLKSRASRFQDETVRRESDVLRFEEENDVGQLLTASFQRVR